MGIGEIFIILIPIFFVIILGYLAGYLNVFDKNSSKGINTLVTKFALPAHLFVGVTTTPRDVLLAQWPFMIALVLGIFVFYFIIFLVTKFGFKFNLSNAAMFSLNSAQPTFAFMGIPVLGSLFGSEAVAVPIAVTGIVVNALLDPTATIMGTIAQREKAENESMAKVVAKTFAHGLREPLALVPLIAVILTLLGFHAPGLLSDSFNEIGDVTSGVALFAVGVTVGIRKVSFNIPAFSIAFLKTIVQPTLMFLIAWAMGMSAENTTMLVLLVAFPGSAVAAMIAVRFESMEAEAGSAFVLSALISVLTLPFLISLLM
ncbi:AEC family transporter [Alkalicoccobacillus plakortidis]|uniref:AEC family transporter n=1 Tax=Alkalicoccobacillus plakortidis TaxID=444060 RepID=A0ABT0XN94_9BACI|nr:AEC family transporter [Alkalicoccobacillus plakortidis]MCM2677190.1 AEC family transporter [Alkalicoccobacillus plakortidis]